MGSVRRIKGDNITLTFELGRLENIEYFLPANNTVDIRPFDEPFMNPVVPSGMAFGRGMTLSTFRAAADKWRTAIRLAGLAEGETLEALKLGQFFMGLKPFTNEMDSYVVKFGPSRNLDGHGYVARASWLFPFNKAGRLENFHASDGRYSANWVREKAK